MSELIKRIFVAAVGIPFALFVIYVGDFTFLASVITISAWSLYEFYGIADKKNIHTSKHFGIMLGILLQILIISIIFKYPIDVILVLMSGVVLFLFIIMFDTLFSGKNFPLLSFSATISGVIYLPLLLSSLIAIREFNRIHEFFANYSDAGRFVILIFGTVWICDSAAYFVGRKIGKHKLFPRVSPKKSWEGAIAGLIFSIIFLSVSLHSFNIMPYYQAAILGLLIGIFGQIGDLFESLLKRDAVVKDSSNTLPGHGGILDRFDSIIFVAPIVLIYLIILTQI